MITSNDKEYLERIAKSHVCPEHGPKLVVAWHSKENAYAIRCGEGHFPEEVTRQMTPIQEHKAGKREAHAPILSLLPKADLATGELLLPEIVKALMSYAYKYDLDPYRGHVVMMYGKPYITIDGYLYHANNAELSYSLKSRPMTTTERKEYQVEDGDHAWLAFVNINKGEKLFNGVGVVTKDEMTEVSKRKPDQLRSPVVAAKPWQMAQKRAEWQAMKRGFPIGESNQKEEE